MARCMCLAVADLRRMRGWMRGWLWVALVNALLRLCVEQLSNGLNVVLVLDDGHVVRAPLLDKVNQLLLGRIGRGAFGGGEQLS